MELFGFRTQHLYSQGSTATDSGIVVSHLHTSCSTGSDEQIMGQAPLRAALLLPLDAALWRAAIDMNRNHLPRCSVPRGEDETHPFYHEYSP
jgi:hypothetical protein